MFFQSSFYSQNCFCTPWALTMAVLSTKHWLSFNFHFPLLWPSFTPWLLHCLEIVQEVTVYHLVSRDKYRVCSRSGIEEDVNKWLIHDFSLLYKLQEGSSLVENFTMVGLEKYIYWNLFPWYLVLVTSYCSILISSWKKMRILCVNQWITHIQ